VNLDDQTTFLTVLSGGTLAASISGALLALAVYRWRNRRAGGR